MPLQSADDAPALETPASRAGDETTLAVRPRTLAAIVLGGCLVGLLIVLGAILPAEYNVDPLGLGKLSGVSRLWAPEERTFAADGAGPVSYAATGPARRVVYEVPLGASDWPEAALEIKVAMTAGQAFLYSWSVEPQGGPGASAAPLKPIVSEFHGHTLAADGEEMTVAEYRKDTGLAENGALLAPFEGIHGWYFKNTNPDPVTVRLVVDGYFELVQPGAPGNEFRLKPASFGALDGASPSP